MILKSIRLKNIRSYLDERVEFPEGSVLLNGDVGSGKSTILLAVDFALFGLQRGEITGSDLLRHGESDGYVELNFEINSRNVVIKRTLKRKASIMQDSGFMSVDGVRQDFSPVELKAKVLELFGYPQELSKKSNIFRYTVYTPQEQMKQILLDAENRLNVLRRIFGIDKYGVIRNNTRTLMTELRSIKREADAQTRDLHEKEGENLKLNGEREDVLKRIDDEKTRLKVCEDRLDQKRNELQNYEAKMMEHTKIKNDIDHKEKYLEKKRKDAVKNEEEKRAIMDKLEETNKKLAELSLVKPDVAEQEIQSNLIRLEKDRDALVSERATIANDVKNMKEIFEKGVCSVCGQAVRDPASFRSSIDIKTSSMAEITGKIENINSNITSFKDIANNWNEYNKGMITRQSLEKDIAYCTESKDRLEKEAAAISDEISSLDKEIEILKSRAGDFKDLENLYTNLKKELDDAQKERTSITGTLASMEQKKNDITERITMLNKEIAERKEKRKKSLFISDTLGWFEDYFIRLTETIEKHVMVALQQSFDESFSNWFNIIMGDVLSVRIDEQFSPVIEQNSYETEYQNLSGGEKTAVALAYRLALNRIINSLIETINTKELLILDEPTDGFSTDQLDSIRDVIAELKLKQIIIVSHEPRIDTFVDNVIRISKENHVSRVA